MTSINRFQIENAKKKIVPRCYISHKTLPFDCFYFIPKSYFPNIFRKKAACSSVSTNGVVYHKSIPKPRDFSNLCSINFYYLFDLSYLCILSINQNEM